MTFDEAAWRNHPQQMLIKAAFVKPGTVFARRVNQASFTYPIAQVTYDNPDGSPGLYTDVQPDMTIGVYSSSDVFKGFCRVRKAPTSTVLYINETSPGDITFADNDKLIVYDDYRLWAKVPRMTATKVFYKDYDLAYVDHGDKIRPVANTGPAYAGDVDPVSGTVDVAFNGANSCRLAAGIGDGLSYVWDFKDGTVISGSHLLAAATVRFPAGQRWVELTVTDGYNSTHRAVVPVLTRNTSTYPAVPVQLVSLNGAVDTGWECSVRVLAADVSDLLPGTLMILYSTQFYAGTQDVINGYAGREHILFVGWVVDEEAGIEPFQDELILTARTALGVLQTLPAYTASIERNLTPTKWHHMIWPNWFRSIVYLMMWHSTITLLCDVERPSFWGDYLFPAADFTAGTLYDQLKTEAGRGWARLTEDRYGRLFTRRNPHLMDATERAALAVTVHLQSTDWREAVRIQRPAGPRVGWLRGGGFVHSTGDLKLALAPGDSPGQGADQGGEINGNWIMDQADLNLRLGHAYAHQNNDTPYVQLTLNHQGLPFDAAWQEAVEFTLDAASNRRGVAFAQQPFVVVSYDFAHDPDTGVTNEVLTLEALTEGVPATTQPVPDGDWEDQEWTPPDVVIDPYVPPAPPDNMASTPDLVYAADDIVMKRSRNFTAVTPTWETVFTPPSGYSISTWEIDYLNPRNAAQVVVWKLNTDIKIYSTSDLDSAAPTWNLLRTFTGKYWHAHLVCSALFDGTWFLQLCRDDGVRIVEVHHTHDDWATLTSVNAAVWDGGGATAACAFVVSGQASSLTDGVIYCGTSGDSGQPGFNRSVDFGASFPYSKTFEAASDFYQPTGAWMPWLDNPDETKLYITLPIAGGGAVQGRVYVSTDKGVSLTDVSPVWNGSTWGYGRLSSFVTRPIHLFAGAVSLPAAMLCSKENGEPQLFVSQVFPTSGADWVHKHSFAGAGAQMHNLGGWPYDANIFFVSGLNKLLYSTDGGETFVEKQWAGYFNGTWCVPIWVEA